MTAAIIVSVAMICIATVWIKLDSNTHKHKWWTEGTDVVTIYTRKADGNYTKLPTSWETHVSQSCEGCGQKRVDIVDGKWSSDLNG